MRQTKNKINEQKKQTNKQKKTPIAQFFSKPITKVNQSNVVDAVFVYSFPFNLYQNSIRLQHIDIFCGRWNDIESTDSVRINGNTGMKWNVWNLII